MPHANISGRNALPCVDSSAGPLLSAFAVHITLIHIEKGSPDMLHKDTTPFSEMPKPTPVPFRLTYRTFLRESSRSPWTRRRTCGHLSHPTTGSYCSCATARRSSNGGTCPLMGLVARVLLHIALAFSSQIPLGHTRTSCRVWTPSKDCSYNGAPVRRNSKHKDQPGSERRRTGRPR